MVLALAFCFSCDCEMPYDDCELEREAACYDRPPKREMCDAFFVRWFYNEGTNRCEQIGYSGCTQAGFETQRECEACRCDEPVSDQH